MSAVIEIDGITVTVCHQSIWLVESAQYARRGDYKAAYHLALQEIQELARELELRDEQGDLQLSDEEREAVANAADGYAARSEHSVNAATLRGLLDRTK